MLRFDWRPADVSQEMFIEFCECLSGAGALKPQTDHERY
jgi:hypothetical protein